MVMTTFIRTRVITISVFTPSVITTCVLPLVRFTTSDFITIVLAPLLV